MVIWGKWNNVLVHQAEPYNAESLPGALASQITPWTASTAATTRRSPA